MGLPGRLTVTDPARERPLALSLFSSQQDRRQRSPGRSAREAAVPRGPRRGWMKGLGRAGSRWTRLGPPRVCASCEFCLLFSLPALPRSDLSRAVGSCLFLSGLLELSDASQQRWLVLDAASAERTKAAAAAPPTRQRGTADQRGRPSPPRSVGVGSGGPGCPLTLAGSEASGRSAGILRSLDRWSSEITCFRDFSPRGRHRARSTREST